MIDDEEEEEAVLKRKRKRKDPEENRIFNQPILFQINIQYSNNLFANIISIQ